MQTIGAKSFFWTGKSLWIRGEGDGVNKVAKHGDLFLKNKIYSRVFLFIWRIVSCFKEKLKQSVLPFSGKCSFSAGLPQEQFWNVYSQMKNNPCMYIK